MSNIRFHSVGWLQRSFVVEACSFHPDPYCVVAASICSVEGQPVHQEGFVPSKVVRMVLSAGSVPIWIVGRNWMCSIGLHRANRLLLSCVHHVKLLMLLSRERHLWML
jgi:hypothetical protein